MNLFSLTVASLMSLIFIPNALANELSNSDIAGIKQMRLEEKLARDTYITLGKMYQLRIFKNISRSEQIHMDELARLIRIYRLEDPIENDQIGVFPDSEFQNLYNNFIEKGKVSMVAALQVGKAIEELDIKDLDRLSAQTKNINIKTTYSYLKQGSLNHLNAFNRNLNRW